MSRLLLIVIAMMMSAPMMRAQTDTVTTAPDTTLSRLEQFIADRKAHDKEVIERVDSLRQVVKDKLHHDPRAKRIDSLLNERDRRARRHLDEVYVIKPREHWTFKLRSSLTGNKILMDGIADGEKAHLDVTAPHKITLSMAASYRGFGIGFALNPAKLAGRNTDFELALRSYGSTFGFEAIYGYGKRFHGQATKNGEIYDIEAGKIRRRTLNITGYYAFNHRRFSFPAIFTQSQIQVRSAGSWLLSASYVGGSLHTDAGIYDGAVASTLYFGQMALGVGYGYNLVTRHHWVLHLSATPEVVVYTKGRLKYDDGQQRMPTSFPNIVSVVRAGVVHNWKHFFAGASSIFKYSDLGDRKKLGVINLRWYARAFFGVRI